MSALPATLDKRLRRPAAADQWFTVVGVVEDVKQDDWRGAGEAFLSTRLLDTLLFGVEAVDPVVFAGVAVMMVAVSLLASYLPARRASRVNPIESLRLE